ncbi:MAG: transglycosylase domain-containing protein [Exilibacterium sp.]
MLLKKSIAGSGRAIATAAIIAGIIVTATLVVGTYLAIQPTPEKLLPPVEDLAKNTYLDRYGRRLNVTYDNAWNTNDQVRFHEIPEFLRRAFIISEDKRFFCHAGVDWLARLNALRQNLLATDVVRGASTITEQVVRILHPRPRTIWSRWVEGFEAMALENRFSKVDILEFYLNQVPFKARRRGVVQAAHYYFNRDLSTLNQREMLALAVLVRAPKWFDPKQQPSRLNRAIDHLAQRLHNTALKPQAISRRELALSNVDLRHDVSHFIRYADSHREVFPHQHDAAGGTTINTTLDLELQMKVQDIIDSRLENLHSRGVKNGAVLVVDHESNEILSWAVGYAGQPGKAYNKIDAVSVRRQPGSALKPFLYADAFGRGWTAATLLDDEPLEESVGLGMHTYHNYNRGHYGLISVREALGNSLNIPAVRAIQFIGPSEFLTFLYNLGIKSLSAHPNVYGDGLSLGNGELTLFELVQAYTVLARMGDYKPLSFIDGEHFDNGSRRVLSEDIASLIADILSDPAAREKEFGWDSVLNLPYQTAVKTGTSSDYRDAWAMGFNDKYTVGVWIGNLDYSAMNRVTGASGPALSLRAIFNELNRNRDVRPLYFSDNLHKQRICVDTGLPADDNCESRDEWFIPGSPPQGMAAKPENIRIRKPGPGLRLAMDPRIPDELEYFEFALTDTPDLQNLQKVRWYLNNRLLATTRKPVYHWKLARGNFTARAEVYLRDHPQPVLTDNVQYTVN